jgi:hypothetical protein
MAKRNYWCYRINKDEVEFFWNELKEDRLRQGWGWLKGQDLRNFKKDQGCLNQHLSKLKSLTAKIKKSGENELINRSILVMIRGFN